MNRAAFAVLLAAACSSAPRPTAPSAHGGSGGSEGGAGGSGPTRACAPLDRHWCAPRGTSAAQRNVGACNDGTQLCAADGSAWGPCEGGAAPEREPKLCDGIDQDCDGAVDHEDLACTTCGNEVCSNGLDDDCNGVVDPPSICTASCAEEPPPACCVRDDFGDPVTRPVLHTYECQPDPRLLPCHLRACQDTDGDPSTYCVGSCRSGRCLCGTQTSTGRILPSPGCGYPTPCTLLGCEDRFDQPCYTGSPSTLGVGSCRGGIASCDGGAWGACRGEVLPGSELCGNGLDDDCDGLADEEDGATHARCRVTCSARHEVCNGVDDDCDGFADETCVPEQRTQICYAGPPDTRNVGACRDGIQLDEGGSWSLCNSVGPQPERCGDGVDADCDGRGGPDQPDDEGCCAPAGPEVCNGIDDDCDGLVDEGLLNACGTCGDTCFEVAIEGAICGGAVTCKGVIPARDDPRAFAPEVANGSLEVLMDAGFSSARWMELSWEQEGDVLVFVAFADTMNLGDSVCASYTMPPVPLSECRLAHGKYAKVTFLLQDGAARVKGIRASWTR